MLLHAANGAEQSYKRILVTTVETDVLVLAVNCVIWNGNDIPGKTSQYLHATYMARNLGNDKYDALRVFHVLTGCDTTSGFAGRGKRTAWLVWNKLNDVTPALRTLAQTPTAAHIDEVLLIMRDSLFRCMTEKVLLTL